MKKLVMAAAILAASGTAMADQDIGCGFGSQVWEGQSGVVAKVLAGTTNGIFTNQLLGITFGTLGCDSSRPITAQMRIQEFVDHNAEAVARDMAVGEGETLVVLADLMGVEDQAQFNQVVKTNFGTIYADDSANTLDVVAKLQQVVSTQVS